MYLAYRNHVSNFLEGGFHPLDCHLHRFSELLDAILGQSPVLVTVLKIFAVSGLRFKRVKTLCGAVVSAYLFLKFPVFLA